MKKRRLYCEKVLQEDWGGSRLVLIHSARAGFDTKSLLKGIPKRLIKDKQCIRMLLLSKNT
jgi:hypothetical protein